MKKALAKDIFRSVAKEKKRFFSILLITALGVAMMTGLRAACNDLRYSADALYDDQTLFDIQVSSTLGLDDDDIEALLTLDEVSAAEGEYSDVVYTEVEGVHQDVKIRTLGEEINAPTVVEGCLPQEENEIAVTESYLLDSGKQVGDTLTFSEDVSGDEEAVFSDSEYIITAKVLDPFDVNNREGSTSFRSNVSEEYTFFVASRAAETDYYTAVYVTVNGADKLMCYSDEYIQLISDVKTKINDNLKEKQQQNRYDTVYAEALAELEEALAEQEGALAEQEGALAGLEDARSELDEIEMAKWYIQSRDCLSGYSNVDSDAASIEGLSAFLPLIFFVVAILISLTAVTRMVEEDRGLIGTYKALGFRNGEIRRKYILFATGASLAGGIAGDICGYIVLPKIIFSFFRMMYIIPDYRLLFQPFFGVIGIVLFMAGILAAVACAMRGALVQMPAMLMRPIVPKGGTRIFLEHIPFIWKKLSFLNKVTARNLFRYKKRLTMTIVGIAGCTGLLICAFSIKNTVTDLMPRQYEDIYRYDILAVAQSADNDKLISYMDDGENIEQYINLQAETVSVRNRADESESVQLFVVPDDAAISDFIWLTDTEGNEISLPDDGVLITHSAADVLDLSAGDEVVIQDLSLNETEIEVTCIAENYLGDIVYVSESCYEAYFSGTFEPNAVLIRLTESCRADDPVSYAKELGAKDGLLSTVSTQTLKDEFSQVFRLINLVVYVIFVMAAALAFVVLFTLSTTNISERCRELATIKVLGFFDREVHLYVNKETLILSCIGIAFGIPAGMGISRCLGLMLQIPGIYFAVSIHHISYLICAGIALAFTLIVNQITKPMLNEIDPAEALKSVE